MYSSCLKSTQKHTVDLRTYAIVCICIGIIGVVSVCEGNAIRRPATTNKTCAKFDEYCINHWDCCSNSCLSFAYRCTRNYAFYPFVFVGQNYTTQATLEDILQANFGTNVIATRVETPQKEQIDDDVVMSTIKPSEQLDINIRVDENANAIAIATTTATIATDGTSSSVPIVILNNQQEQQQSQQFIDDYMQTIDVTSNAATAQSRSTTITATTSPAPTNTKDAIATSAQSTAEIAQSNIAIITTQTPTPTPSEPATTTITSTESTPVKTRSTADTALADCKEIGEKCYRNEECCTMRCHGFLHQCVT